MGYRQSLMEEITFTVEWDQEDASFIASWDDPSGKGGITTEGAGLAELQTMIVDAATGYFQAAGVAAPKTVRLHFIKNPELAIA